MHVCACVVVSGVPCGAVWCDDGQQMEWIGRAGQEQQGVPPPGPAAAQHARSPARTHTHPVCVGGRGLR